MLVGYNLIILLLQINYSKVIFLIFLIYNVQKNIYELQNIFYGILKHLIFKKKITHIIFIYFFKLEHV